MGRVPVRKFWGLYGGEIQHGPLPTELPPELSLGALFDRLFGALARHDVREASDDKIHVACRHCHYVRDSRKDICEGHIGILT